MKWSKDLWIVAKVHDDGLELLPVDGSNITAGPTSNWPTPKTGLASVELVAEHMKAYIERRLGIGFFPEIF